MSKKVENIINNVKTETKKNAKGALVELLVAAIVVAIKGIVSKEQ